MKDMPRIGHPRCAQGTIMYHISENAIPTLAGDIRNVVNATDTALTMQSQMLMSVIEVIKTSNIPLTTSQRLYSEIANGLKGMVDARDSIRQSVATMTAIGKQTAHPEQLDGCAVPPPKGRKLAEVTAEKVEA